MIKYITKYNFPFFIICFIALLFSYEQFSFPIFGDEVIYFDIGIDNFTISDFIPGLYKEPLHSGHPPLYPLLNFIFYKVSNSSIFSIRVLNFIFFCFMLFASYSLVKSLTNQFYATTAVILIAFNQIVFMNTSLLLPDVLSIGLGLYSWHCFKHQRLALYVISAVACVLVRETGLAFSLPILIISFRGKLFINKILSLLPFISYLIFLMLLKLKTGTAFLHPNASKISFLKLSALSMDRFLSHIGYITTSGSIILVGILISLCTDIKLTQKIKFTKSLIIKYAIATLILALTFLRILIPLDFEIWIYNLAIALLTFLFFFLNQKSSSLDTHSSNFIHSSLLTIFLFTLFMFFYGDLNIRETLPIIIFLPIIGFIFLYSLNIDKNLKCFFICICLFHQVSWIIKPFTPNQESITSYKDRIKGLSSIKDHLEGPNLIKIWTTANLREHFENYHYGWNYPEEKYQFVQDPKSANYIIFSKLLDPIEVRDSSNFLKPKIRYEDTNDTFELFKIKQVKSFR